MLFIACGNKATAKSNPAGDTDNPPKTVEDDGDSPKTVKDTENSPASDKIWVSYELIGPSELKKYKSYDYYGENDTWQMIAFSTKTPVKDFSWLGVQVTGDDYIWEKTRFELVEVLFTTELLLPEKPFIVSWQPLGIMSVSGISYRDETGKMIYYAIQEGNYGEDPETYDGPALLVYEMFPQRAVTGRYIYMQNLEGDGSMTLDLSESSYTLKVNDKVYSGVANIEFGKNYGGEYTWFVELEGIKWDHDWSESFAHGIPPDDKWVDKDTYGIHMWLDVDELCFQNSGNPMSPYSIFDVINSKFARLKQER